MKLQELIKGHLTERDLRGVLEALSLDHSGHKEELIEKVLKGIEGKSAKEVLSLLSSDALARICKANGIQRDWPFFSDINEQMIKKICSRLHEDEGGFEEERAKKKVEPPSVIKEAHREPDIIVHAKPETRAMRPISRTDPSFEGVARDVEEWLPKSDHLSEDGYRDDLSPWLWSRGHRTVIRKGDSTVDVLVDNKYPIMIIIEPSLSDYHRLFGQIHRHLESYQSVILVVCRPRRDGELEFFEERVRRSLTYSKHPYKIIRKR